MEMILLNGTQALNLDHVVDVRYIPEHEYVQSTENFYQETGKVVPGFVNQQIASRLEITTTAVEFKTQEYDYYNGFHVAGGCSSKVIVLTGQDADVVWKYIEARCDIPVLEA